MSKYDNIVPYGDEIDELTYGVTDSGKPEPCCICGARTTWVGSLDGEFVCSQECEQKYFEQVMKEMRRA